MSINLKPHSLKCGSSLTVLDFGSLKITKFSGQEISLKFPSS